MTKQLNLKAPAELIERIADAAYLARVSSSEYIRQAINDKLRRDERRRKREEEGR